MSDLPDVAIQIGQAQTEEDVVAVRTLIREFTTWALKLEVDNDQAPTFEGLEAEIQGLPGIYIPPNGRLLLAKYKGEPVGCICLKGHDDISCEPKRLYVREAYRGYGIGKRLFAMAMSEARAQNYKRVVLDTHRSMTKAQNIYTSMGFKRIATPDDFPEALKHAVVFMECDFEDMTER